MIPVVSAENIPDILEEEKDSTNEINIDDQSTKKSSRQTYNLSTQIRNRSTYSNEENYNTNNISENSNSNIIEYLTNDNFNKSSVSTNISANVNGQDEQENNNLTTNISQETEESENESDIVVVEPEICSKTSAALELNSLDMENVSLNEKSINISKSRSLELFEQNENKIKEKIRENKIEKKKRNTKLFSKLKYSTVFYENVGNDIWLHKKSIQDKINISNTINIDVLRSPSIDKGETPIDYNPTTIKNLLANSMKNSCNKIESLKTNMTLKKSESIDLFDDYDSPRKPANRNDETLLSNINKKCNDNDINTISEIDNDTCSSHDNVIDNMTGLDNPNSVGNNKEENVQQDQKKDQSITIPENDTIDDFETIYKELSATRVTEFDLLVTQNNSPLVDSTLVEKHDNNEVDKYKLPHNRHPIADENDHNNKDNKYNLRHKLHSTVDENVRGNENKIYNLRHKIHPVDYNVQKLLEENLEINSSSEDFEINTIKLKETKRNQRLKQKNIMKEETNTKERNTQLKNIENLQKEFSDITMNIPAPTKIINKPFLSPEKLDCGEENIPPLAYSQTCPAKR